MPIKITMPALSPTMEKGNLAKWLVQEGDTVNSGDIIAEIETDKATMEVEAADEGVLAKIIVPAGTNDVAVNALIAVLAEDGEDIKDAVAAVDDNSSSNTIKSDDTDKTDASVKDSSVTNKQSKPDTSNEDNSSLNQEMTPSNIREGVFASPLARRLAKQANLDLTKIDGTGPHGRIVQRDIEKAQQVAQEPKQETSTQESVRDEKCTNSQQDDAILKLFQPDEYEIVPHNSMRKVIARRLVESKQNVPHFYVTVDCSLEALLKLRSEINSGAPIVKKGDATAPAYKVSVNDMVIKAVAMTLKRIPAANVSWLDSGMIEHKHSDVGVAVSIPNGLITPIVRHAEEKSLSAISIEMKDLIKRARQMKLSPEEYQGGTSSVSNMGMFGVKSFSAIVNPPQSTIFAIGAGEKRAVVKNGELAMDTVMSVTVSADHRAVDGALAAEVAQTFKSLIENPLSMLV